MNNIIPEGLADLELFQICDSTFPIGTFNHSFGFENYLRTGAIKKAADFDEWLKNYYISQYRFGEGLLVKLTYEAAGRKDFAAILRFDDTIAKSTPAMETRNGTKLIARQMIRLIQAIHPGEIPYFSSYAAAVEGGQAYGNPAIAFALYAASAGASAEKAFFLYGYSVASTLVQNAVRAVPLGQSQGQVILHDIIDLLGSLWEDEGEFTEEDLGANAPGLELAQIRHETQEARLFMS